MHWEPHNVVFGKSRVRIRHPSGLRAIALHLPLPFRFGFLAFAASVWVSGGCGVGFWFRVFAASVGFGWLSCFCLGVLGGGFRFGFGRFWLAFVKRCRTLASTVQGGHMMM